MRSLSLFAVLAACSGEDEETPPTTPSGEASAFALRFAPTAGGQSADCAAPIAVGANTIGLSDVRFYVSNVQFWDADGSEVEATFDENEFQYQGVADRVALVDLTGTDADGCSANAITFSEGTSRKNDAVTGTTLVGSVASVTFDVGVPQLLMKEVIAENTLEGAPSPLGELYWSWASGYRHFVFNLTVSDGMDDGEGYLHVGSTGCAGGDGELALETKDQCDFVNTPRVELSGFDLASDVVTVDLAAAVGGVDFRAPIYDPTTFEVIGEQPGLECHSSPMQDDCAALFANFGVDLGTGASDPASNVVFVVGGR